MAYQFLESGDLEANIIAQFLSERSEEAQTAILENLELKTIALIKTKLNGKYDLDAIFEASGLDRHYLIIDIVVKIVLHQFIRRNAARKVPKDYVDDYNTAMKLLESIKEGKEQPVGLPPVKDDNGDEVPKVMHGNNRNNDFYI